MNDEERFVEKCSRVDFDGQGFAQARVWTRIMSPRPSAWRRWAFAAACAALVFAAGVGVARWTDSSVRPAAVSSCTPAEEPYLLVCVKGRSAGYCCKQHSFYQEDVPGETFSVPARKECRQRSHPDLPSFYIFNQQNC